MKYICDSLADILKIHRVESITLDIGVETFLNPVIMKNLNICIKEDTVKKNNKLCEGLEERINYDEYLREYIWCFYSEYLV